MNKKIFILGIAIASILAFIGIGFAAWGIVSNLSGTASGNMQAYNIRNVSDFVNLNTAEYNEDAVEKIYYTSNGFTQNDSTSSKTQLDQYSYYVIDTSDFSSGTYVRVSFNFYDKIDTFFSSNTFSITATLYDSNKNAIGNPIVINSSQSIVVNIEPTLPNTLGGTYYIALQLHMTVSNFDSNWYTKLVNNGISMGLYASVSSDAGSGWLNVFDTNIGYSQSQIVNLSWNYSTPFTYDGQPHSIELNSFSEPINVVYSNNEKTDASSSYNATATLTYSKKYIVNVESVLVGSGTSCSKAWVINKADPTFNSFSYKAYEGDTVTATNATYQFNGVDGNALKGNFIFSPVTIGSIFGNNSTTQTKTYNITGTFTPTGALATNYNSKTQSVSVTVYAIAKNNESTVKYYGNLYTAVSNTSSGKTIYVIPNLTNQDNSLHQIVLNENLTVDSNKTLCLPYEGTTYDWGKGYGDVSTKQTFSSDSDIKVSIKLSSDKTITIMNNSQLLIGGQAGTQGQGTVGLTRGLCAEIVLDTDSKIDIYGTLHNFGFIKDKSVDSNGLVSIYAGANVLMPLTLYDYKGGSITSGSVDKEVFPFTSLDFPNIMSKVRYYSNSTLVAKFRIKFRALVFDTVMNDDIDILGNNNNYMLYLKSGYVDMKYTPATFNQPKASAAKSPSLDYTQIDLYGELDLSKLSMQGYSTENFYLPMSYKFKFNIKAGSIINCPYKVKFMSGSTINIENGGIANITNNVLIYSIPLSGTFGSSAYDYPFNSVGIAHFNNEGTVNISTNGGVYGLISYGNENSNDGVIIKNGTLNSSVTVKENIKAAGGSGSDNSTYIDYTLYPKAVLRVNESTISESTISGNSAYYHHGNHWDGTGCEYLVDYQNIVAGDGFDSSNITSSYQNTITDTITLNVPTYSGEFEFGGFYSDSELSSPIPSGNLGFNDLRESFDLNTHTCTIYVYWVSSNIPKATYRIDRYSGSNAITSGSEIITTISDNSIVSNFESDNRPVSFTSSNIKTYTFNGWQAKIYSDNSLNTLIDTVDVSNTFAISIANSISNGNYIVFNPKYIENTYAAPTLNLTLPSTLAVGATGTMTCTVSNYNESVFDYTGGFVVDEDDYVTGDLSTLNYSISGTTATYTEVISNKNSSGDSSSNGSVIVTFGIVVSILIDGYSYNSGNLYKQSKSQSYSYKYNNNCLAYETLVLMSDGTYKEVQYIEQGDELLVFNHENGRIETSFVTFNDFEEEELFRIINLHFSNNKTIGVIYEHGFFDLDLMTYVYITENNYQDFIGHRFYGIDGEYILDDAYISEEIIKVYSPITCNTFNYFTEGILSMPGGIEGLFNYFEYDDNLKYDEDDYNWCIENIGLFTFEDLEYFGVSRETFDAYNAKYFKIAMAKGLLTEEMVYYYVNRYGHYFDETD